MAVNTCPVCMVNFSPMRVVRGRFECPECHTKLRLAYSRTYVWARFIVCAGAAFAYMWKQGVHDSFMVFVISFALWPAFKTWDALIRPVYPPDRIVPVQGTILTLGLQQ